MNKSIKVLILGACLLTTTGYAKSKRKEARQEKKVRRVLNRVLEDAEGFEKKWKAQLEENLVVAKERKEKKEAKKEEKKVKKLEKEGPQPEQEKIPTLNVYNKLEVVAPFEELRIADTQLPEALSPNADGSKVFYTDKGKQNKIPMPFKLRLVERDGGGAWQPHTHIKKGRFDIDLGASFNYQDKGHIRSRANGKFTTWLKTAWEAIRNGDSSFTDFDYVLEFVDQEGTVTEELGYKDFGFTGREAIKHPKVSPQGKWLTFYTKGDTTDGGLFLYNLETKVTSLVNPSTEKHPTWSPDGTKLLFHYQRGGSASEAKYETSYLGYYDMTFNGNEFSVNRIMIDDPKKEGFVYHKHPTLYPGTDLLFFHGEKQPDGSKHLMVRRLYVGSPVFTLKFIDPTDSHRTLKKLKHPANGYESGGLFAIGKTKDKTRKENIEITVAKQTVLLNALKKSCRSDRNCKRTYNKEIRKMAKKKRNQFDKKQIINVSEEAIDYINSTLPPKA